MDSNQQQSTDLAPTSSIPPPTAPVPQSPPNTAPSNDDPQPIIADYDPKEDQQMASEPDSAQIANGSTQIMEQEMEPTGAADGTGVSFDNIEDIQKDMEQKQVRICRSIDEVRQLYEKDQILGG